MKKIVFSAMVISLLVLSMASCASSSSSSGQMVITVTGIPAQYEGMVGGIILDTGGSSENVAWALPTGISGGVNENYMLDWVTDTAWGKSGTYRIIYVIYTDSSLNRDTASSFLVQSRSLTGNVSIPFAQFTAVN